MYRKVHALFVSDPLGIPSLQRRRLMPHRIYKEKRQPDIDDAGQRQQRTEKDAEDVGGFASVQVFAAQHDAGGGQHQQHYG